MSLVRVTFPGGSVLVKRGTTLSRALNLDGLRLETPCGGKGRCRKCIVQVVAGDAPPTERDKELLWPEEIAMGYRLACGLPVESDIAVSFRPRGEPSLERRGKSPGRGETSGGPEKRSPLHADYGVAIDLGTTTITATLLTLSGGREVAAGSVPNPQAAFGADVMTRLELAVRDAVERDRLQAVVLESIASLMLSMTRAAGICLDRVTDGVLVGNSVMHHLALGFDVSGLARAPYRSSVTGPTTIEFPGLPLLYAPPPVGGFVGSDAVAAILAEALPAGRRTQLLVDLGTNSEVALVHKRELFVTSAPAGPAFEGAEISQGMAAAVGAIDSVQIEHGILRVGVIGDGEPLGFCGSGLMDAVSALLAVGLLDTTGRLRLSSRQGPGGQESGGQELAGVPLNGGAPPAVSIAPGVSITQKDVRAVQLAKGAVRSAIDVLMRTAGCGPDDIERVLLAGAFGSYVRPETAISLGLIPPVPVSRIMAVGNSALRGAKMMLGSETLREEAVRVARAARHVSLHEVPGFEEIFMGSLNFPQKKESEAGV
jgi:uncharacterized 2Fe-2S/4Fe-4S cluster protein (DUF4445 family)